MNGNQKSFPLDPIYEMPGWPPQSISDAARSV